jgi:hypothetical protein
VVRRLHAAVVGQHVRIAHEQVAGVVVAEPALGQFVEHGSIEHDGVGIGCRAPNDLGMGAFGGLGMGAFGGPSMGRLAERDRCVSLQPVAQGPERYCPTQPE